MKNDQAESLRREISRPFLKFYVQWTSTSTMNKNMELGDAINQIRKTTASTNYKITTKQSFPRKIDNILQ